MSFNPWVLHCSFHRFFKVLVPYWAPLFILFAVAATGWVLEEKEFHLQEIRVSQFLTAVDNPLLDAISLGVAYGFATVPALLLTLSLAGAVGWWRGWRAAAQFTALTLAGWLGAAVIKPLVSRARPNPLLLDFPLAPKGGSFSFPSGHTAFATGLFLALALVVAAAQWRTYAVAVALLGALGVGFTRVYVGAHFVSDTLAGLISACAGVSIYLIFARNYAEKRNDVPSGGEC